jgi:3-isopropylmalate/(R)-2-methylmalate dehydratase small subunit
MNVVRQVRCHKFGHDISNDDGIIPFVMIRDVRYNPGDVQEELFAPYCMAGVEPDFAKRARHGGVLAVGRQFGHGNAHIQSCYAIKGLDLAVVAESTARGFLRLAIAAGILILPRVPGLIDAIEDDDLLTVDFEKGTVLVERTGMRLQGQPLPRKLLDMVADGGLNPWLKGQMAAAAV